MTWNHTLTKLRNILADLYETETTSRRLVADAGINSQLIAFSSRSIDNWQSILEEAQKQGKMDALIAVVEEQYPQATFQEAVVAYRQQLTADSARPATGPSGRSRRRSTDSFANYENGLEKLLAQLDPNSQDYNDALVQQARLTENINRARRFGDTGDGQAGRAEIIDRLNAISLDVLGVSFNKLCE